MLREKVIPHSMGFPHKMKHDHRYPIYIYMFVPILFSSLSLAIRLSSNENLEIQNKTTTDFFSWDSSVIALPAFILLYNKFPRTQ